MYFYGNISVNLSGRKRRHDYAEYHHREKKEPIFMRTYFVFFNILVKVKIRDSLEHFLGCWHLVLAHQLFLQFFMHILHTLPSTLLASQPVSVQHKYNT